MARIDDYKESFRLASIELKKRDAATLAKAAGAEFSPEEGLIVPFLGNKYIVQIHPETDIRRENSSEEVPLPDRILIAHYLLGASGKKRTGKVITFRHIPDGHFYFEAFQKRARDPFVNFYGNNGRLFVECATNDGGIAGGKWGFRHGICRLSKYLRSTGSMEGGRGVSSGCYNSI